MTAPALASGIEMGHDLRAPKPCSKKGVPPYENQRAVIGFFDRQRYASVRRIGNYRRGEIHRHDESRDQNLRQGLLGLRQSGGGRERVYSGDDRGGVR